MKVKIFRNYSTINLEDEINEFIKDKTVVNMQIDVVDDFYIVLIMYN